MLAKAFDIPAERIERADEVDAALNRLLNSETAYLLQYAFHRRNAYGH